MSGEGRVVIEPCRSEGHDCGKWIVLVDGQVDAWLPTEAAAQAHAHLLRERA